MWRCEYIEQNDAHKLSKILENPNNWSLHSLSIRIPANNINVPRSRMRAPISLLYSLERRLLPADLSFILSYKTPAIPIDLEMRAIYAISIS